MTRPTPTSLPIGLSRGINRRSTTEHDSERVAKYRKEMGYETAIAQITNGAMRACRWRTRDYQGQLTDASLADR
jgi:hypothetical protein